MNQSNSNKKVYELFPLGIGKTILACILRSTRASIRQNVSDAIRGEERERIAEEKQEQ